MGPMQSQHGKLPHGVLGISRNQYSQMSSNGGYPVLPTEPLPGENSWKISSAAFGRLFHKREIGFAMRRTPGTTKNLPL